ncbi:hypothetical protein GCM10010197_06770 [Nocardioides luteus]|uniref:Uncharacterized protein n=1 Tax=Nocardioides luteus TaxID=1844 RepID=A0ABQ5SQW3_9ACTN|nr:hypothetical protein GCM10010197_06770 [Nocardioides luteus]GLJ66184.1 hypothetical protein GCM10017579_02200 [Nocardioides luteus]
MRFGTGTYVGGRISHATGLSGTTDGPVGPAIDRAHKSEAEPALLVLPHGDPQNRLDVSSMRPITAPA